MKIKNLALISIFSLISMSLYSSDAQQEVNMEQQVAEEVPAQDALAEQAPAGVEVVNPIPDHVQPKQSSVMEWVAEVETLAQQAERARLILAHNYANYRQGQILRALVEAADAEAEKLAREAQAAPVEVQDSEVQADVQESVA